MEPREGEYWWVSYKGQGIVMHVYRDPEGLRFRYAEGRYIITSVPVDSPKVELLVRIPRASKIIAWNERVRLEFDADLG